MTPYTKIEDSSNGHAGNADSGKAREPVKLRLCWHRVLYAIWIYPMLCWGLYHGYYYAQPLTLWFGGLWLYLSGIGVTAGVHRMWTHRAFKAKLPVRIALMMFFEISNEETIYQWVINHRTHHKFTDTDADPTNIKRGFFFAEIGWLHFYPHPECVEAQKKIDMSDVLADPVVQFDLKYHRVLVWIFCYGIPALIPHLLWGEALLTSYLICGCSRYIVSLYVVGMANSVAHIWGYKPYNKDATSTENFWATAPMAFVGENWHNFHHAFPYDYRINEIGYSANHITLYLDLLAWFGLVYDRKTADAATIEARKKRNMIGSTRNEELSY